MFASGVGNTIVSHREMIDTFAIGSNPYVVEAAYPINAGDPNTFPWLSGIAMHYEKYRFRQLRFFWSPSCPSTAVGTVALVLDSDAADPQPSTLVEAFSHEGSVSGAPWNSIAFVATAPMLSPIRYTASALVPNTDIKTYDLGTLYLISSSAAVGVGQATGLLWVEYVVELITPQIQQNEDFAMFGVLPTATRPLGTAGAIKDPSSGLDGVDVIPGSSGNNILILTKPGDYYIDFTNTTPYTTLSAGGIAGYTGTTLDGRSVTGGTAVDSQVVINTAQTEGHMGFWVKVTAVALLAGVAGVAMYLTSASVGAATYATFKVFRTFGVI